MGVKLLTGNGCRVSAEDDRAFNMGFLSKDLVVFKDIGEMFRAEVISNNCIRIHSGEGMIQGGHLRTPYGEYDDATINNGTQGMHRYDIIAFQYEKNAETLKESVELVVLEGKQVGSEMEAVPPNLIYGDSYKGDTLCQYPLYTVYIDELSVKTVKPEFSAMRSIEDGRTNRLLWSGVSRMIASDTSALSENVSDQPNGIVLVFSRYQDNTARDEQFHCFFVPKYVVSNWNGKGHSFQFNSLNFGIIASKYLYIYDDCIKGHDNNVSSGTSAGVTYDNSGYALRAVIGV